jgi:hypothetical protein
MPLGFCDGSSAQNFVVGERTDEEVDWVLQERVTRVFVGLQAALGRSGPSDQHAQTRRKGVNHPYIDPHIEVGEFADGFAGCSCESPRLTA